MTPYTHIATHARARTHTNTRTYVYTCTRLAEICTTHSKYKQVPHDILPLASFLDQIQKVNNLIRSLETIMSFIYTFIKSILNHVTKKLQKIANEVTIKNERKIVYMSIYCKRLHFFFH